MMYLPPQISMELLEGILIGLGIMSLPALIIILFAWSKSESDNHYYMTVNQDPGDDTETHLVRR